MELGNLYQALIAILTVVLTAVIPVIGVYVTKWITANVDDKELQKSLLITKTTIKNSVRNTIQNASADFTHAVADGKLSKEELELIQNNAIVDYKKHVAPELQKRLDASVKGIEVWIGKQALGFTQEIDTVTN
jgi:phage tail tape-measure protein